MRFSIINPSILGEPPLIFWISTHIYLMRFRRRRQERKFRDALQGDGDAGRGEATAGGFERRR